MCGFWEGGADEYEKALFEQLAQLQEKQEMVILEAITPEAKAEQLRNICDDEHRLRAELGRIDMMLF